jgi:V8-like Glu-specific endopeptidase
MNTKIHRLITTSLIAAGLISIGASAGAQTRELSRRTEAVTWSSGTFDGRAGKAYAAARRSIAVRDAPWIQVHFRSDTRLGPGSRLELRSELDGGVQVFNARTFAEANGRSAYFNGGAITVELLVGPKDRGVQIEISHVVVGEQSIGVESICGTDNRVASSDVRVARIDPIGCTGWLTADGQLLTAGHCLAGSGNNTLSFNPPLSLSNGTVQFPPPEDQYSIDQTSFTFVNGGVGNDWGIFAVFDNAVTGLQPIDAQGAGFALVRRRSSANIRITGHGTDSGTANQTQQTHVGPNSGSSGTTMRYRTDTTGGNSGSPIIDAATDEAVGIHTHGGCTTNGGRNSGTSFYNSALWNAL